MLDGYNHRRWHSGIKRLTSYRKLCIFRQVKLKEGQHKTRRGVQYILGKSTQHRNGGICYMKALSIRQPWAWLIANGYKDIENRRWLTKFRGKFLIHTGKKFDFEGYEWVVSEMGLPMPRPSEFKRGGIVGVAEIIDCVREHKSPWFSGPYGFVMKNAKPLPFKPLPGKLRFFEATKT
jgi:hypothetical protein